MLPLKNSKNGAAIAPIGPAIRRAKKKSAITEARIARNADTIRLVCTLIPQRTNQALNRSGRNGYASFVPGKMGSSLTALSPRSAKLESIERCQAKSAHVTPAEYQPSGPARSMWEEN